MKLSERIAEYEASDEWLMDGALAEALIARMRELEGALNEIKGRVQFGVSRELESDVVALARKALADKEKP